MVPWQVVCSIKDILPGILASIVCSIKEVLPGPLASIVCSIKEVLPGLLASSMLYQGSITWSLGK
jgi:hypothetical protein